MHILSEIYFNMKRQNCSIKKMSVMMYVCMCFKKYNFNNYILFKRVKTLFQFMDLQSGSIHSNFLKCMFFSLIYEAIDLMFYFMIKLKVVLNKI